MASSSPPTLVLLSLPHLSPPPRSSSSSPSSSLPLSLSPLTGESSPHSPHRSAGVVLLTREPLQRRLPPLPPLVWLGVHRHHRLLPQGAVADRWTALWSSGRYAAVVATLTRRPVTLTLVRPSAPPARSACDSHPTRPPLLPLSRHRPIHLLIPPPVPAPPTSVRSEVGDCWFCTFDSRGRLQGLVATLAGGADVPGANPSTRA